jgi:hypothetical protein
MRLTDNKNYRCYQFRRFVGLARLFLATQAIRSVPHREQSAGQARHFEDVVDHVFAEDVTDVAVRRKSS